MLEFSHVADLPSLLEAIARSPIVIVPANTRAHDFADWCEGQNADLDVVILDWLRSQAPRCAAH